MTTRISLDEAKAQYAKFVENFDPSPIDYGDDYLYLPKFDDWLDEEDIEII